MVAFAEATLIAYVDDELDAATVAAVEQAMRNDPDLARKIQAYKDDTALVRAAFEPMLHHSLPPLRMGASADPATAGHDLPSVRPAGRPGRRRKPARITGHMSWWMTLAAAVGGFVIGGTSVYVSALGTDSGTWLALQAHSDRLVETATLDNLLENQLSGTSVEWFNERTGHGGVITLIRTFQTTEGQYCREFTATSTLDDTPAQVRGVACRSDQDEWRTRRRVIES
ncbi:MAG: hypothetical protein H6842_00780 [Rhodospirillaceae bacterium]|nr:hypothetical protein [Rhodospirillaceae bacterium]